MKTIIILLIVLGITFASTPSPYCVLFFKGDNYTGDSNESCSTDNNISNSKWKNRYSSVKLGNKVASLSVYSKTNFEGNTLTYTSDQATLGPMDNDIQSFAINTKFSDDCIRFWEERYYRGKTWTVCKSKITYTSVNHDKFNYVQFGGNINRVYLYNKTYYQNFHNTNYQTLNKGGQIQDNQFRSFQIIHDSIPKECIWLYQEEKYAGDYIELCHSTTNLGSYKGTIGSIQIGEKVRGIRVYDNISYQGQNDYYSDNQYKLESWNNRIHSLTISLKSS